MPYPPTLPPFTRTDTTPQLANHPSDHNMIANALADIVNVLGVDPAGSALDLTTRLNDQAPVGVISLWATLAAPTSYLLLDGTPQSRTGFPDLFAQWGTTFGVGDGTSTFGIPDARGCVVVMRHAGQGPFDTIGKKGGARDAILPSHDHGTVAHQHDIGHDHPQVTTVDHDVVRSTGGGDAKLYSQTTNPGIGGYGPYNALPAYIDIPPFGGLSGVGGGGLRVESVGDGARTDKNLQPYITLNLIVKALA